MMMPRLAGLLPLLMVTACVSGLKSNLPAPQTYLLQPQWPMNSAVGGTTDTGTVSRSSTNANVAANTVQVLLGTVAPGLDTDGIALLRPGQRLDHYSGARWAANAPVMMQILAIDALRAQHRFAMVESDRGPFASALVLSVELRHFQAEYVDTGAPTIHVALIGTLGRRADHEPAAVFAAESRVMAQSNRMQAVVAAFERAAADALTQLAADIVPSAAAP